MANRQQKRHPLHPSLTIQYPSKKRVIDKKKKVKKSSASKGKRSKKRLIF